MVFVMLIGLFGVASAQTQNFSYNDSWGKQGFTLSDSKSNGVEVVYSIQEFSLENLDVKGETMKNVVLPGTFLFNNEGQPNLPGSGRYIAIPQQAKATVRISQMRMEIIENVDIIPAARIPLDTEPGPAEYKKNAQTYAKNEFYPAEPVILSDPTDIRGVDVVMLGITPFQYNPVTKQLRVYRDMKIEVSFEGGNSKVGNDRLRSRWWDPILSDLLLNINQLPKYDYSKRAVTISKEEGAEYLIITPTGAEFQAWADTIRRFRTEQGIKTKVVTLAQIPNGTTPAGLETYIQNAYSTWTIPPAAVLLLGDYGTNAANSVTSPIWDNYCVSDNILGDVNNNDITDIVMARITANNAAQLQVLVGKFLSYERNPPTSEYFYAHPITALGWQTERWFQICSEVINGFMQYGLNKTPIRENKIYEGATNVWSTATNTSTVVNYFKIDGSGSGLDYIPPTTTHLTDWGGNATRINADINAGSFMLQHRDHGMETGWGEPSYENTNINGLHNTDLTFIFSINCLTGKYNYSGECFAEKFHRYTYNNQFSGALGLIAASEVSYSFVNDAYTWGMYDNMWTQFMPAYGATNPTRTIMPGFANVAGKYFLQASNWPYNTENKEVTYHLFHMHGDAFLNMYSEVPQNLTVVNEPVIIGGTSGFEVSINDGAFIALTRNGEIIGVAEGTGETQLIPIPAQLPGDTVKMVITAQNYYRYSQNIPVIPANGPYIIKEAYTVNDSQANNNGMVDYGETVNLSLTMKNIGLENGQNVMVKLRTTDPYVTLLDSTEVYPTVNAGGFTTIENGFSFSVSNSIPDEHRVTFQIVATIDTTWFSSISVIVNAPLLQFGNVIVNDQLGNNNGKLEPGETADLLFAVQNVGHASIANVEGTTMINNMFVTLNNTSASIAEIAAGSENNLVFNVTANDATPEGFPVEFITNAGSGAYNCSDTIMVVAGELLETWEGGNFTYLDWTQGGTKPWILATNSPYEGLFCAKSGKIAHGQKSSIALQLNVYGDNNQVSFYYRLASENNGDYLQFYIDATKVGEWSGTSDWTQVSYPVTGGTHTFKWQYSKNNSISTTSDAVWIDYIKFPPVVSLVSYAGEDATVCAGNTFQCSGFASNQTAVLWTTTGTGTFSNAAILNPIYTPSQADITAGNVTLTLSAISQAGTMKQNSMTLTINTLAPISLGNDTTVCDGTNFTLTAGDYDVYNWNNGASSDSALLITQTGDYSVVVTDFAGCSVGSNTVHIVVNPAPALDLGADIVICEGTQATLDAGTGYVSYNWNNGQANTQSIAVSTEGLNYVTVTNSAACSKTDSILITVNPLPTVSLGADIDMFTNETKVLTATAENVSFLWNDNSTNSTLTLNGATLGKGTFTYYVTVTDANSCSFTDTVIVRVEFPIGIDANESATLKVYPNPTNGLVYLQFDKASQNTVVVEVSDLKGQLLYAQKFDSNGQKNIDVSNLQSGIYLLKIKSNNFVKVLKLNKN